jgi:hypothetical protein
VPLASAAELQPRCLIPGFDGATFSLEWKDALWARFSMEAPRRQKRSVERFNMDPINDFLVVAVPSRTACCRHGPGSTGSFSAHPPRLATLVPKQTAKEQPGRGRHALLPKQGPQPRPYLAQPRRPKLQRSQSMCQPSMISESWWLSDSNPSSERNCIASDPAGPLVGNWPAARTTQMPGMGLSRNPLKTAM